MNKVIRVFLETDMRSQHMGLIEIAKTKKVNLSKLEPGEHVIFINQAGNKMKLFSASGVLSYIRKDRGKIDLNMIEFIPSCWNARTGIDWDEASRKSLERKLGKTSFSDRTKSRAAEENILSN